MFALHSHRVPRNTLTPVAQHPSKPKARQEGGLFLTTQTWEQSDWNLSREWISLHLGEEWAEAHAFFGRMVGHLAVEAAPGGDVNEESAHNLREKIRAHIPATLDEILPFATRYVWDKALPTEDRQVFFTRLRRVANLAGATWTTEELNARVEEILT